MNVEVYSGGGLKAFHLAVKLTDKWLTKKAPSQLIELFLKHYDGKFGTTSTASDYCLGARGVAGTLEEGRPLRCGVTPGVALELRSAAAAAAAPPAAEAAEAAKAPEERAARETRKKAPAKKPAPEAPVAPTRTAEEAFSSLCALAEVLASAEFQLHTALIYRVVEGLVKPSQLEAETAPHYETLRRLVEETSVANLDVALRRFACGGEDPSKITMKKLRKHLEKIKWALAKEVFCAKAFREAPPVKRARLRRFENQHELPRRDEICEVLNVDWQPRTRWRPKWAPKARRLVVLEGLGLAEEGDEKTPFDATALSLPDARAPRPRPRPMSPVAREPPSQLLLLGTEAERHACEFHPFTYFVQNNYDPRYCLTRGRRVERFVFPQQQKIFPGTRRSASSRRTSRSASPLSPSASATLPWR